MDFVIEPKWVVWDLHLARSLILIFLCSFLQDAFRAVTSTAVREARLTEIREEIMKSEKLRVAESFLLTLLVC